YLSIYISLYLSIYLSISLSIYLSIQPVNYPTSPFSPVLCVLSERELPANAVESWVDPQSAAASIIHADNVAARHTHRHTHTHTHTHAHSLPLSLSLFLF